MLLFPSPIMQTCFGAKLTPAVSPKFGVVEFGGYGFPTAMAIKRFGFPTMERQIADFRAELV
jgi:hypothetical protein